MTETPDTRPDGPDEGRADGDAEGRGDDEAGQQGPIIRDKRRIDPMTGAVREPPATAAPAAGGPADLAGEPIGGPGEDVSSAGDAADSDQPRDDRVVLLEQELGERVADLQRVQAEYANYRRRVDRDRDVVRDTATATVLTRLLPVLDDIGRAREHGELEGAFRSVGEALEQAVTSLGLVTFGTAGEPFDPTVHEALTHTVSDEVTEATAVEVYQPGYRIGDRVVRPARVAVAAPQ